MSKPTMFASWCDLSLQANPCGSLLYHAEKRKETTTHTHTSLNRLSKLFSQRPSLYVNSAHLEPWPRYFDQTTEKIFEAFTASWSSGNRRVLEPFVFVTKRRERARQTSDTSLHQFGFWFWTGSPITSGCLFLSGHLLGVYVTFIDVLIKVNQTPSFGRVLIKHCGHEIEVSIPCILNIQSLCCPNGGRGDVYSRPGHFSTELSNCFASQMRHPRHHVGRRIKPCWTWFVLFSRMTIYMIDIHI